MSAVPPAPQDREPAVADRRAAAGLFAGAAAHYQRYRPRYPDALFADLIERCGLERGQRVLDIGCGPGFLAVPLAALGAEVVAVDPQPEMLAAGRAAAAERGATSITWIEGTAEDVLTSEPFAMAPACCATFGRSFHWMQRESLLQRLDGVIVPRGAVVLVGEERPDDIAWREAVRGFVQQWHGGDSPTQAHNDRRRSGRAHVEVLRASPFRQIDTLTYPVARHWSIDSIVGYVYSTSSGNPHLLGAGIDAFEAGLRACLAALPGAPEFAEQVDVTAIIASRP